MVCTVPVSNTGWWVISQEEGILFEARISLIKLTMLSTKRNPVLPCVNVRFCRFRSFINPQNIWIFEIIWIWLKFEFLIPEYVRSSLTRLLSRSDTRYFTRPRPTFLFFRVIPWKLVQMKFIVWRNKILLSKSWFSIIIDFHVDDKCPDNVGRGVWLRCESHFFLFSLLARHEKHSQTL